MRASPRGAYFVEPGGSAVRSPRERQSVVSTAKLVTLDREVRVAAIEVPPQKTLIKVEKSSEVTPRLIIMPLQQSPILA